MSRKSVYGVGVNDADYSVTSYSDSGKQFMCPFYSVWKGMLERCYSLTFKKKNKNYTDCTVCDEWLLFSNFKSWMENQDWKGKCLDKDILKKGNRVYCPEYSLFVTQKINNLPLSSKSARGRYPSGVYRRNGKGKYFASCSVDGKQVYIGSYFTEDEARKAYLKFKRKVIDDVAEKQKEPLRSALLAFEID